ncbi:hypothetical protein [Proteiniphilum sp. UBA5384]|uniref:hypothetical protein n=1 Tax=Proteiniphilum sp. UBA5384 TaxID=1947279 RepID=UPI0025D855C1|nr:hypothetical protein [Proteiniphilum sp. UBA5384]
MNKLIIYLFFISTLYIFSATMCKEQPKKREEGVISPSANAIHQTNQSAEKLFERLMASFSDDWMEREADPNLYPAYYGGSFIDNEGVFVITVTGNSGEHKKQLSEVLGTDNFNIETVQYSYRQMMEVMDKIDIFLMNSTVPEDHPLMSSFAGAYPEVTENRVKVLLTQVDEPTIRLFRKDIINSPLIIFEQGNLPDWNQPEQ